MREAVFIDARAVSVQLLGTDQYANLLLAGAAVQLGSLPLSPAAIEKAIALNGAGVQSNIAAFRYGRLAVAEPETFRRITEPPVSSSARRSAAVEKLVQQVGALPGGELERLLRIRVPDLVDYQSLGYAGEYVRYVADVVHMERERCAGSEALSATVARQLYKLMAYKDEYEVARLSLSPAVVAAVTAEFGEGARIAYRLHPPVLRALGLKRKLVLGPWFRSVYRILVAARRLRGTRADLFGLAKVRRCERRLVAEYKETIDTVLSELSNANLSEAVEIADLPDMVRGYESIKLASVERYRAATARAIGRFLSISEPVPN